MKTILVPLDGSLLSQEALPHALGLARRSDAELLLVAVDPVEEDIDRHLLAEWKERKASLERLADRCHEAGWKTRALTLPGRAAEGILQTAHEAAECLIVMSSHGRSGVGRWLLGSVTDRVVRHADCSVMVVRCPLAVPPGLQEADLGATLAGQWPTYRRTLVPLDGAGHSEEALHTAIRFTHPEGTIMLMRVLDFPAPLYGGALPPGWAATATRDLEAEHRQYLSRQQSKLAEWAPGLQVEIVARRGSPAVEILELAEEADLLVMTNYSRTWLERAVVGSVVGRVLHHAPCPMLLVKEA